MDKSQFQVPVNGNGIASNANELVTVHHSLKRESNFEPYRFLMNIRDAVESFRDTAIAIEQKQGRFETIRGRRIPLKLPARPVDKILKSLIDAEWKVGGELYGKGKGYTFGLGARENNQDRADWYHAAPNPAKPGSFHVVHFVVTPKSLEMLLTDGRAYTPTIQDIERFVHGAYHYLYRIRELYPLDATIDELLNEIAADIPRDMSDLLPKREIDQGRGYVS